MQQQNQQMPLRSGSPTKLITFVVIAVILCIIGGSGCSTYNNLVAESQSVDQAWANVQNQYQRRLDLIPNLVNTVKGYAEHESSTFEKVTAMRAGLTEAYNKAESLQNGDITSEQDFQKYAEAQNQLNKQLGLYINAVHEAYPDLKANENFKDLQTQLEGTENRIATQRMNYTTAVQNYNMTVLRFPAKIWAGLFGFQKKPQFAADAEAQHAPKVEF